MSPLARSLLALAAAALLCAACAGARTNRMMHCNQIFHGTSGNYSLRVKDLHVDQTDVVLDVPPSKCPPFGSEQVGTRVLACDKYGPPPKLQWLGSGQRVRVTCQWNAGQTCPQGLDIQINQHCKINVNPVTEKPHIRMPAKAYRIY